MKRTKKRTKLFIFGFSLNLRKKKYNFQKVFFFSFYCGNTLNVKQKWVVHNMCNAKNPSLTIKTLQMLQNEKLAYLLLNYYKFTQIFQILFTP